MPGFDAMFLGVAAPMPRFQAALDGDVLRRETLAQGVYAHYANYTVVMNAARREPVFAALNIDRTALQVVDSRSWRPDARIGAAHQLTDPYYDHNPWDKGHMARRAAAAWGDSVRAAKQASDDTYYYSNAALQHENFNRDEWVALEDWVLEHKGPKDGRLSVFSGPVPGAYDRTVEPPGLPIARVPPAFFKVMCYCDAAGDLKVHAFMLTQDVAALTDRRGRRLYDFENYQVTVAEIEELTGLVFDDAIAAANPLLSTDTQERRRTMGITHFPERLETDGPHELMETGDPRHGFLDDELDVFIAAAMIDPEGDETAGEWVSILNLTNEATTLDGWRLRDRMRRERRLEGRLAPGAAVAVRDLAPLRLPNAGGTISLFHANGMQVDRVRYKKRDVPSEGRALVFAYPT